MFSSVNLFVNTRIGAGIAETSTGWSLAVGAKTDFQPFYKPLLSGFVLGADIHYINITRVDSYVYSSFNPEVLVGFSLNFFQSYFSVTPQVAFNVGKILILQEGNRLDRWVFSVTPSVSIDFPIGNYLSTGLEMSYQYFNFSTSESSEFCIGLNLSFLLPIGDLSRESKETKKILVNKFREEFKNQDKVVTVTENTYNEFRMNLSDLVFEVDSATVNSQNIPVLEKIAGNLASMNNITILVEGYTDDSGSDKYNLELSKDRANAVMALLVKNGVRPEKITAKWYGKARPIAPNNSEANRAKNRRVNIRVIMK